MDRAKLFAALRSRSSAVFGKALTQPQVKGTEAILDACQKYGVTDQHHVADVLAQVYHETGGYMLPIKETVMPSHKDKNPSDATVIKRLNTAFAKGQLSWVKKPYWQDGWFGRGPIQTTHKANYEKIGEAIGVDLVKDRDRILEPEIGSASAVVGMRDGLYTGKKLSDFDFEKELAQVGKTKRFAPRRIVNGVDGTDEKIAKYHQSFYAALSAAGYESKSVPAPAPVQSPKPDHEPTVGRTDAITIRVVQERLKELGYSEVGKPDGIMGKLTRTAILAFKNENDIAPVNDVIDQPFLDALDKAQPRNLPRETVAPEVVRKNATEVRTNWMIKVGALVAGIPAAIGGLVDGVIGNLGFARETIKPLKDMFSDIPSEVWLIGVAVIAGGAYLVARQGEKAGVDAFRTGERR